MTNDKTQLCKECGMRFLPKYKSKGKRTEFCSTKCSNSSSTKETQRRQTMMEKYGAETPMEVEQFRKKRNDTNTQKYGGASPLCRPDIKEKSMRTMKERYGVFHALQSQQCIESLKQTNMEKYGFDFGALSQEVQNKRKETLSMNYGVDFPFLSEQIKKKALETIRTHNDGKLPSQRHLSHETLLKLDDVEFLIKQHHHNRLNFSEIADELGVNVTTITNHIEKNDIEKRYYHDSRQQKQVSAFIESLGVEVQYNVRNVIPPKELDIYLPKHNLAIEYCGLYWHSDIHERINRHTHLDKLTKCNEAGIRLITLFEDEWLFKRSIVEDKLRSILGKNVRKTIYARKTTIVNVSTKTKREFFNANHIQGDGPGSIVIGLMSDDKLVACMGFIQQKGQTFYLNRYATSEHVVGGFSKLLSYFCKTYQWQTIISFADRRWSEGGVYHRSGFALDKILIPDYEYVDKHTMTRIHKFNFRHKNLYKILGDKYNANLSETENMKNSTRYTRIWNCGLLRFQKTIGGNI